MWIVKRKKSNKKKKKGNSINSVYFFQDMTRYQVSGYRLQVSGFRYQVAGIRLQGVHAPSNF
jgi:hypothetical protein